MSLHPAPRAGVAVPGEHRPSRRQFLAGMGAALCAGCGTRGDQARAAFSAFGAQGRRPGSFVRPRAVGVHRGEVYVIDMSGRVQVFDGGGTLQRLWNMPDATNGTPTAIAFHEETVFIPDTHYHRIIAYSREGEALREWGTYGSEPGAFIYPTGLARASGGICYISEYGTDAERVQVFTETGEHLRAFGRFGAAPGQFNRAMALTLAQDHVCVADTANHRVQVFRSDGELVRVIDGASLPGGAFHFPHDIATAPDESLLVVEYGANRVTHLDIKGRVLGIYGGPGRGPGGFKSPRGVAVSDEGVVYVADTDNHRVQWFALEAAA